MPTAKENVDTHIVSSLIHRRNNLRNERDQLAKAKTRIGEIDEELGHIDVKLKEHGHEDPPLPGETPAED